MERGHLFIRHRFRRASKFGWPQHAETETWRKALYTTNPSTDHVRLDFRLTLRLPATTLNRRFLHSNLDESQPDQS